MRLTLLALPLLVVLAACSTIHPAPIAMPTVAEAPACMNPVDAVAFIQSKFGDAVKAEQHLHLTDHDTVQAFAQAMVKGGAPVSVLGADEIVVVRAKLPDGSYGAKESVQFFAKGCKTEGGFVAAAAIEALLGTPA